MMSLPPEWPSLFSGIKAIIYDLDGTLVDTEPLAAQAILTVLAQQQKSLSFDLKTAMTGRSTQAVLSILREHHLLPQDEAAFVAQVTAQYNEYLDRQLPLLPGAVESIHWFANRFQLALVSGSDHAQILRVLNKMQVQQAFDPILGMENYPRSKPHPDGYLLCAQQLALQANQCLVLEDSLPGVQSAKSAGMRVIAISAANHTHQDLSPADAVVPTLSKLLKALQQTEKTA